MSACDKCNKIVKPTELKACTKCNAQFHYQCLGIPIDTFSKESKTYKSTWKCTDCRPADKHGSLSTSMKKNISQVEDVSELKSYIGNKLEKSLSRLLKEIKRDLIAENSDTRVKIQELTESVNFMSAKYDQLQETFTKKIQVIDNLEAENFALRSQVSDLNNRLNHIDQQSRESNLEIQCVPEHKSENIKTIIQQLANTVGCKLHEHELLNYHRVAKVNQDSKRPRSIIVKLPSPLSRDKVIAAVQTYNKNNKNNKLNSSHLGLAGDKVPVYVCEHLSPINKQLHAAARKIAREKNIQFVWVRNGRIFMRKDPNSKSFVVPDHLFLEKL